VSKDEKGYIVVETIGSFMLFTLLMISILSLINIVTIQTRVHYALTQTANELSMYSYVLDALGLSDEIKALHKTSIALQGDIDQIIEDLDTIQTGTTSLIGNQSDFFNNLDAVVDAVGSLSNTTKGMIENPQETFINLVRYGLDKGKNKAIQEFVLRPMLGKYLHNGEQDADTFLVANGVSDGLGSIVLEKSIFIDDKGDITVVASYNIDYIFGALPLPFGGIQVEQTAKTKAWLGGV